MKATTIGVFQKRSDAEKFINIAHNTLGIANEDISFVYRNTEGKVKEVDASQVSSVTPGEGAKKGATAGAVIGALGGLAALAGLIPVVGPIFAAGPIVAALGLTGGVGVTAAGAVTGAAVGGLTGALVGLGTNKERAQQYEDMVMAGNILVAVNSSDAKAVQIEMLNHGATEIEAYEINV